MTLLALLFKIGCLAGGILLSLAILDKWDGESDVFKKVAKVLMPFKTIIGGAILVIGILFLLRGGSLIYCLVAILAGLLLLTDVLGKLPSVGDSLAAFSKKLMPFKTIIGLATLAIGVLSLLGITF